MWGDTPKLPGLRRYFIQGVPNMYELQHRLTDMDQHIGSNMVRL
jgi:hypothetical protein